MSIVVFQFVPEGIASGCPCGLLIGPSSSQSQQGQGAFLNRYFCELSLADERKLKLKLYPEQLLHI